MLGEGLQAELQDEAGLEGRQAAGPPVDLRQTTRVALIGFCFHANFNYRWLGALERALPGGGAGRVAVKVAVDQIVAAPVTISVFYTGLSVLEGKDDPFEDLRQKFWTSYTAGLLYWSSVQLSALSSWEGQPCCGQCFFVTSEGEESSCRTETLTD
nr:PREDICTED: mpv17-like protein isoform X2 [Lepisosteus oculatus]